MVIARRRSTPRVFALLSVALASACSSGPCDTLTSCDIRERSCQDEVAEVVACLRGDEPLTPKIEVVDADDFVDSQVRDLEDDPLPEDVLDFYEALHLLQLMPSDLDPEAIVRRDYEDVAAFFDPETRRVTVLDRGDRQDGAGSILLLAHEIVHALQWEEFGDDVPRGEGEGLDSALVRGAMLEGDAMLWMEVAKFWAYGFDAGELDFEWERATSQATQSAWFEAASEPALYQRARSIFSYPFGIRYLAQAYREGGAAEVRRAMHRPPGTSRQLLRRYGTPAPEGGWFESLEEHAQPVLEGEFEHLYTGRLGLWLFELFHERFRRDRAKWFPQPEQRGYRGDSLSVFRSPGGVTIFWRVRFESGVVAKRFEESQFERPEHMEVRRTDRDLIFAATTDGEARTSIARELDWGPAAESVTESEARFSFAP